MYDINILTVVVYLIVVLTKRGGGYGTFLLLLTTLVLFAVTHAFKIVCKGLNIIHLCCVNPSRADCENELLDIVR